MKTTRVLFFVIASLMATATPELASSVPDPIPWPWPQAMAPVQTAILPTGPDPIPWPKLPVSETSGPDPIPWPFPG